MSLVPPCGWPWEHSGRPCSGPPEAASCCRAAAGARRPPKFSEPVGHRLVGGVFLCHFGPQDHELIRARDDLGRSQHAGSSLLRPVPEPSALGRLERQATSGQGDFQFGQHTLEVLLSLGAKMNIFRVDGASNPVPTSKRFPLAVHPWDSSTKGSSVTRLKIVGDDAPPCGTPVPKNIGLVRPMPPASKTTLRSRSHLSMSLPKGNGAQRCSIALDRAIHYNLS